MESKLFLRKAIKPQGFKINERKKIHLKKTRHSPLVNIIERDNYYFLSLAVPGLKREDLNIIIHNQFLNISAGKQSGVSNFVIDRCEYDYTKWRRSFSLPGDADVIFATAKCNEGELIIAIPKGNTMAISEPLTVYVY